MPSFYRLVPFSLSLCSLLMGVVSVSAGAVPRASTTIVRKLDPVVSESGRNASAEWSEPANLISYNWNLNAKELPLLGLPDERLKRGLDQSLTYPMAQFNLPIFHALNFDEEHGRYLLPVASKESQGVHFIEFENSASGKTYTSVDGSNIQLIDNDTLKTFRTSEGTKYIFVRYPDGEFRCATIKEPGGANLNLLYSANGLALHGLVDSFGRTITFDYARDGVNSVTQTWMANSEGLTKTWSVGDPPENRARTVKYSHAFGMAALKRLPGNAVTREYTAEMAASDKMLARIFGGPDAVAGANGFEPAGLAAAYPFYRGDIIGDDGKLRRGHLSYAMHLYGSPAGNSESSLYVPPGFTSHSGEPSPTDAAVTFYYPRLGNQTDVTLAVFHIANFNVSDEGDRVCIGNLGGPGGSSRSYRHSHIEFYRGNVGLPASGMRPSLRIDPSLIFDRAR